MSPRMFFGAAAAALLLLPGAALGAPDRTLGLGAIGAEQKWTTDIKAGFVYSSTVSKQVPPCSPAVFACDATLVKTEEYGNLVSSITGTGVMGQETLTDVDLHVYRSDATGAQGALLGEAISATNVETVTAVNQPAGYYLVYIDWYLGVGSVNGTVRLAKPKTPLP